MSHISVCKQLFRAALRVRLKSCLSLLKEMDNFDSTRMNADF